MTSRALQQWRTQLKSLLAKGDIDGAALHALSFPTPAYRLRCLIRICREVREPARVHALLALAQEQVALISQPQAQSHAWGWLCRAYARHHLLDEASCALLVADPYARKAHLGYLIWAYRYERRHTEALQLCETWREVAEPHERALIETLVGLLDQPLEKKRRKRNRKQLPPEPLDIDPALLQAIVAAQGERATHQAVKNLLSHVGYFHTWQFGKVDRELFRTAMRHAHRWLPLPSWERNWLQALCDALEEHALWQLFYDARLQSARQEPDPDRRADALRELLRTTKHNKSHAEFESLVEEVRASIRLIPHPHRRAHGFTFLGQTLHALGWRGKRRGWED
jgi:hypothetical protein